MIIFEKNNVLLIRVKNYDACNWLFARPSINWCIATNEIHWREYVCKPFRKQYFIVDYNNIFSNNSYDADVALIGFTTDGTEILAAHTKNDSSIKGQFENILSKKGILEDTKSEIEKYAVLFGLLIFLSIVVLILYLIKLILF